MLIKQITAMAEMTPRLFKLSDETSATEDELKILQKAPGFFEFKSIYKYILCQIDCYC